ncbi:hypothetical protein [Mycobacterium sp. SA01]|uniref:hypothetical protein n=1 Tax=Mycobacterium sp. SA01 TaxID=3238820 RepID=UPI00351B7CFD
MDADAVYDVRYTYVELCAAMEAEAATLPPEAWRSGEWNLNETRLTPSRWEPTYNTWTSGMFILGRRVDTFAVDLGAAYVTSLNGRTT